MRHIEYDPNFDLLPTLTVSKVTKNPASNPSMRAADETIWWLKNELLRAYLNTNLKYFKIFKTKKQGMKHI